MLNLQNLYLPSSVKGKGGSSARDAAVNLVATVFLSTAVRTRVGI